MKTIFIKAFLLISSVASVQAAHLNKGAIICVKVDAAKHIVQLDKNNDPNFFTYYERYVSNEVCAELSRRMTLIANKKLDGGISKVIFINDLGKPQDIFAITREIKY
jgi:hypothetical protein